MGEYAKRKSDGADIKIGTCEDMYYLRYEDRHKVWPQANSLDPVTEACELRFRLPFPDEDSVLPGEYEQYARGERLWKSWCYRCNALASDACKSDHNHQTGCPSFEDESAADDPGVIQLRHDSGLLVNVPCYHGVKLPEVAKPVQIFWNGKSWHLELQQLRPTPAGVKPIVGCRFCGHKWRYDWSDVWDYIQDAKLRAALREYRDAEVIAKGNALIAEVHV